MPQYAPHVSILVKEFLDFFSESTIKVFVDGTLGAGGHAAALLKEHPEIELFIGIDQDPLAMSIAKERLKEDAHRVRIVHGNYSQIASIIASCGAAAADGIFLDLGVSSMQLDLPEKGFSFSKEGPLDMRMDPTAPLTAEEIVNTWSLHDLGRIFRDYGEESRWKRAATAIVEAREKKAIKTTHDLVDVLRPVLTMHRGMKISPFTLVFQALRLCVNSELEHLEKALPAALDTLSIGGRMGVISFHSLEDRLVKNTFRLAASKQQPIGDNSSFYLDKEATVRLLTKKPVCPTPEEVKENPRSRSAKMRFVEKIYTPLS